MRLLKVVLITLSLGSSLVISLSGCSPEVGSEKWCQQMKEKETGDWTANQAADYAKHCLFPNREQ